MLDNAIKHGITTWDTSPVYGRSAAVIGQYLKEKKSKIAICTKLPSIVSNYGDNISQKSLNDIIYNSIEIYIRISD